METGDPTARHGKAVRTLRQEYDNLLSKSNNKRPTNYAKLRVFTQELMEIVERVTTAAGQTSRPVFKIIEKDPDADVPDDQFKPLVREKTKSAQAKADRKAKEGEKPKFIPKEAETAKAEDAEIDPAREAALKDAKEIEDAADAQLKRDKEEGIETSRGVQLREEA